MTRRTSDITCVVLLFLAGQLITGALFSLRGPVLSPDSGYYLGLAPGFPESLSGPFWGYVGYIGLLRLGLLVGSQPWPAVIAQSVGVTLAALAMLSLGRRYSGELAGWLAASFYLLHPLINQWTRYVLTESLFYAGIILTVWFLSRSIDNNAPFSPYLWLVAVATASLRPNGILLLGAVASALVLARHHSASLRVLVITGVWSCIFVLALFSPSLRASHDGYAFATSAWKGVVVQGVPETSVSMPAPASTDTSNAALVGYAAEHPVDMARLGLTRVWWEMKQVRPWYSRSLNAFTAISMSGLYAFSAIGAWVNRRSSLVIIVACVTAPFAAVIAATWAIWEGRFGWWFLVLWIIVAGTGFQSVLQWVTRRLPDGHPLRRVANVATVGTSPQHPPTEYPVN